MAESKNNNSGDTMSYPGQSSLTSNDTSAPSILCNILKSQRFRLGFTKKDLAKKIGVSAQSVTRWERGAATPTPEKFSRLAEILQIDLDTLTQSVLPKTFPNIPSSPRVRRPTQIDLRDLEAELDLREKRGLKLGLSIGREEGYAEGFEAGEKEGIQKTSLRIALKMLKLGEPYTKIQAYTDYSEAEIRELGKSSSQAQESFATKNSNLEQ